MSCTEMVCFKKNGEAEMYAEIENAFRGAMAIWDIIEEKYLPVYRPSYVPKDMPDYMIESYLGYKPRRTSIVLNQEKHLSNMHEIWDLFNNDNISRADKIVLGTTFDTFLVKKENFSELIDTFNSFEGDTSLKEQSKVIAEMLKNEDIIAVGWNQTSVSSNQWTHYKYNEENDEYEPYNCIKNKEHFWLFDGLN